MAAEFRAPDRLLAQGLPAEYHFAGRRRPVVVVAWTKGGEPVLVRADGSMFVAPLHRVKLTRRELP